MLPRPKLSGNASLFPVPSCAPAPVPVSAAPSSDEGHAGALLPRPKLSGNASLFPVPSCAPDPVPVPAAPSSDEGHAPQLLPPTHLPALASAPAPVPAPFLPVAGLAGRHSGAGAGTRACPLTADRVAPQPEQRRTRHANLSTAATNPRHGATFLRRSGATFGNATEDAAVIVIRSPGAAAPLPICCRSTTCCRSPRAVVRSRPISSYRALLITACATATDRLRLRSPRCSASSALLARNSTALADGSQVAQRDTLRISASRACIFAAASSDPGRGLPSTNSCRFRRSDPRGRP